MKERIDFLMNSINDIQSTIRAIDGKFFGIFAILLLPLTELDEISKAFKGLYVVKPSISIFVLTVLILCWTVAAIVSMLGIYSVSNPKERIKNNTTYDGKNLFYRANLFKINFLTQFAPISIESNKTLEALIQEMEIDEQVIFKELAIEQVKLAYIRDLKIERQRLAIILLLSTILLIVGALFINSVLYNG